MTDHQGHHANIAIIEALGLDPHSIRRGATLTFTDAGPILAVEHILRNADGKPYAIDDQLAVEFKRYRLVPLEDPPVERTDLPDPGNTQFRGRKK